MRSKGELGTWGWAWRSGWASGWAGRPPGWLPGLPVTSQAFSLLSQLTQVLYKISARLGFEDPVSRGPGDCDLSPCPLWA